MSSRSPVLVVASRSGLPSPEMSPGAIFSERSTPTAR
jgi:hypothetical protein